MIYDKYIWKTRRTFIFPVYSINRFNHDMRQIEKVSNIGKNLTFLTARNTFAYLASTYGISFETIYKIMGYRDMNTTRKLLPASDKSILNEFAGLIEITNEWGKQYSPNI
ncbi:hypothetical protein AGMMS50262_23510 [Bacteroidia bacterium]|nr:hypothetical protein AGMMS50262_23510 [Bacteroidia bacterium]